MSQQFDEDAAYAAAHAEALSSNRQPGLWARVFSQSGGDENKAVAAYISKRFEQLRQASSEAEEAAQKLESENKASIAKVQQKVEHVSVEKNEKHDTEVVSTFDIERRLREEFGVKTHTRRKDQEWILRDQHGLIGTFYGEAAFKEAAKAIFLGHRPNSDSKSSTFKSRDEAVSDNRSFRGIFDPTQGLGKVASKHFIFIIVFGIFFKNMLQDPSLTTSAILIIHVISLVIFWLSATSLWKAAVINEGRTAWASVAKAYIALAYLAKIIFFIYDASIPHGLVPSKSYTSQSVGSSAATQQATLDPSLASAPITTIPTRPLRTKESSKTMSEQQELIDSSASAELQHSSSSSRDKLTNSSASSSDIELTVIAERNENLRTCLTGQLPMLCKRNMLTSEQKQQADDAERRENLSTCMTGQLPMLCKHSWLSSEQKRQVAIAEWEQNRETCLSGQFPMLCNKNLLNNRPN